MRHIHDLDVKFKVCVGTRGDSFWLLRAGQLYLINQLVEFNPDSKSLVNRQTGRAIQLQLPASLCFLYLITHASDIVSQNTLMTIGWGERNNVTTTNTFYQAILTLRNALADVGLPRDTVKTISRRGLRLNENTQVETITLQQSEVSPSPVIEEITPAKIIPSTPQQTTQIPWFEVLFSASAVIATLIIWLVWYQTRPVMPFSKFVQASMRLC